MPAYVKYNVALSYFAICESWFNADEVDRIIDLEDLEKFSTGTLASSKENKFEVNKKYRDSDIYFLYPSDASNWVFDKFGAILGDVNHKCFMYDIDGIENFQYTRYKKNQHYDWHFDILCGYSNWERKISASIVLSDPDEYEGGEFEIMDKGNPDLTTIVKPTKGSIIFFASWMPHRIKPITKGVRKSLVTWVMGKRVC